MSYQKIKNVLASAARLIDSDKVAEAYDLILGLREAGLSRSDMDANLTDEQLRKLRKHSRMRRVGSAEGGYVYKELDRGDYGHGVTSRKELYRVMEGNFQKARTDDEKFHARNQVIYGLAARALSPKQGVRLYKVLGLTAQGGFPRV